MNERRARLLKPGRAGTGPVLWWMHRDHRVADNWTLLFAHRLAVGLGVGLVAVHCLDPAYPGASAGHYRFLLDGLDEVERDLAGRNIPFVRLLGDPPGRVAALARELDAAAVAADFDPLRHKRRWLDQAGRETACPLYEVDARNVVPCFVASDKAEYAARTIRPRIRRLLPEFLEDFPAPPGLSWSPEPAVRGVTRAEAEQALAGAPGAAPLQDVAAGSRAGLAALASFLADRLDGYAWRRNDPARSGQSGLSPWLHFGMVSAQRVALAVAGAAAPAGDREAFLEELIVRRELADNFCLYRQDYDRPSCFPDWARRTLEKHAGDPRPFLYARAELEAGATHDPAWNAAQRQMVRTGRMHGYMRMYWCKKILEWSPSAGEAQALSLSLNDTYSLDGRDPNGYAGVAWSIGGVHDRPWGERPVYGTIRSMSLAGLARKFDLAAYLALAAE